MVVSVAVVVGCAVAVRSGSGWGGRVRGGCCWSRWGWWG